MNASNFTKSTYKTTPCPLTTPHNKRECNNYHSDSEKRRNPKKHFYNKIMCNKSPNCPNKNCQFSHSIIEQLYHPDNYKKKFCKSYFLGNPCNFGVNCALAHSEEELEIRILHHLKIDNDFLLYLFKSEFCPFNKFCPDKFKCVYAHNWQDFKRPFDYKIFPLPCKNWNKNLKLAFYVDGCENGFGCLMCHGWKEYDYHLKNFKKNYCKNGKGCKRKTICSFLHCKGFLKKNKVFLQSEISSSVDTQVVSQKEGDQVYCLKNVKKFFKNDSKEGDFNNNSRITKHNSASQIKYFKKQDSFRFKKNRKRFMNQDIIKTNDSFEKEEKIFSLKNVKKSIKRNETKTDMVDLIPNFNFSSNESKFMLKKQKSENFNFENICRFFK